MSKRVSFDGEQIAPEKFPVATGWRVIIAPIHIEESTESGIVLTHTTIAEEKHGRFVGRVMSMGPLCYSGDKFKIHPDQARAEPWCKVGDIVSTSQYAGSTLPCKIDDDEFYLRIVNDEEIVSVISDISILNI